MHSPKKVSTLITETRREVFIHAVAEAAGCECRGYALAAFQARGDPTIGAGEPVPWGFIKAWNARVAGAEMQDVTRAWLYERAPHLRDVYDDVLWTALSLDLSGKDIHACVERLRLNGAPLPGFPDKSFDALCGGAHWQHLGYLLMILRSRSYKFLFARLKVQQQFSSYFVQSCLCSPLSRVANLIYQVLDELWRKDPQCKPLSWPVSEADFNRYLTFYQRLSATLIDQGWVSEWGEHCLMWLAYLDFAENKEHLRRICGAFSSPLRLPAPRRLATRVKQALVLHQRLHVSIVA